jgi:Transglycosylase
MALLQRSERDLQTPPTPGRGRRRRLLGAVLAVLIAGAGLGLAGASLSPHPGDMPALVVTRLATHGGVVVSLPRVAPVMRQAVVAAEDERFYRHHGIDTLGLARAAAYDLSHFSLQEGASTITEQLAKVLYLGGNDSSPWRKLEDAALAVKLERAYTKEQILDAYLNTVYFGHGAYGIGAASRRFFGRSPSALDLSQASLLAGLIQAPAADDPFTDPSAARARQDEVLVSMIRNGFITADEAAAVLRSTLSLSGGRVLEADTSPNLALPALISGPVLAGGTMLLSAGALGLILHRRLSWSAVKPVSFVFVVVGLLLLARSLQAG